MSDVEEFGAIVKMGPEETAIEWRIERFFSVVENKDAVKSPAFIFAGNTWYIELELKCSDVPGFMYLHIVKEGIDDPEVSIEFNFGLKMVNGSIYKMRKGIFRGYSDSMGPFFFELAKLRQLRFHLVPFGECTIICKLKCITTDSSNPASKPDLPIIENLIDLDTLSENLEKLFNNKESCDVTLYVQNQEFKAHRAQLMARSSVFEAMFLHDTSEKKTGIVTITDCDPGSFEQFLKFLYTGKLEKPSFSDAFHLYETANKYDIQEIMTFCSNVLAENLTEKSFCNLLIFANKYDDEKLLSEVQFYFSQNHRKVLATPDWGYLVKNYLDIAQKLLTETSEKEDQS